MEWSQDFLGSYTHDLKVIRGVVVVGGGSSSSGRRRRRRW